MKKNLNYQKLSKEELIIELMQIQQKHDSFKTLVEKGLAEKENEKLILEKLIKASDEFIEFRDQTPDYDSILQTIIAISGARFAAINIFDDKCLDFKTVAVSGKKEYLQVGLKMLGFNVINMHWKEDPIRAEKTKNQTITRFMRLHELTGITVSKNVIRLIEKTLGIGETFVVKISKERKVLGDFTLLYQKGETMINDKFVDLYAHQAGMFLDRQKSKKDLQESEELYRNLILMLPDGVYKSTHEGKFVNVNPAMVKILGYQSEEELLAIDIKTQLYFEPSDRESVMLLEKLEEKGVYRLKKKDGSEVWVEDHGWYSLDENGNILFHEGIIRDITDRKYAEDALRKSEQQFRSVLETVSLIGIMLDNDGRITLCNDFLLNLTGWKREDVMQQNWFELFLPPEIRTDIQFGVFKKSINEGKVSAHFENEIITLGGERRLIAWNNTILHDHLGAVSGVASIGEDITDRKRTEAEIKFKTEKLLELNAEKDKFFSIIAHDIRGPFSGFLGLTQLMAEDMQSLTIAQAQEIAISMSKSAKNLYQLLENLLQWSQIQQGAIPFKPEVVHLRRIVVESIEVILEPAKIKGIEIETDIAEDMVVFADNNMFQTIIRNLVSNAIKFTPKEGKVKVSARLQDNNNFEISIQDTGIGMSKAMVDNLFRLDVQTNRKGTEEEPSTGLGLILCKEFVDRHGGKIWVESDEGIASTFYFTLPYHTK